jgi:hypothetical protein
MKKARCKSPGLKLDSESYRELQRRCWSVTAGDVKGAAAWITCRYTIYFSEAIPEVIRKTI